MTETAHPGNLVPVSQSTVEEWWNEADADEVEGHDLLRDEALLDAVGVPFLAYHVVYRDGVQRKGADWRDDYASLEFRIAPASVVLRNLARIQARRLSFGVPQLTPDQMASLPGEQLVLNDGSTGLYRQVTQYLDAKGLIQLPEDMDDEGEKGQSRLDLPRSEWLAGADEATKGIDIGLRCSRGLRFSDYQNEFTGDKTARTWYIA